MEACLQCQVNLHVAQWLYDSFQFTIDEADALSSIYFGWSRIQILSGLNMTLIIPIDSIAQILFPINSIVLFIKTFSSDEQAR